MTNTQSDFDIVIAGGGLSGSLTALALSQLTTLQNERLNIAIVEANEILTNTALTFDSRVLALSHGSVDYLKSLDVWPVIKDKAEAIETIHISDKGYYGKARVYAHEHGVDALGQVIEMSVLGDALVNKVKKLPNIQWYAPDSIKNIQWRSDQVSLELHSDAKLTSKLLIACDGGQSQCRQMANIASETKDYLQTAIIANLTMAKAHKNVAYERFTENGPFAMLPLPETGGSSKKCSMVWTLSPSQAQDIMALSDNAFKREVVNAFGAWLGDVQHVGKRAAFPLVLVRANDQVFHRTVLVGNASHTIHPIAGQGFNLGLRDVRELAIALHKQLNQGLDIGNLAQLMSYAQKRLEDHRSVIQITDSLVTLFSNQLPPLVVGRNVGLKVMNYCSSLKNTFVDKTMGY